MSISIKRLLSMLVVMAMVVSMIVPMNFSAVKAEETETPETESAYVNPGQAGIDRGTAAKNNSAAVKDAFLNATGSVTAVCPVCAAKGDDSEKTWTAIDSAFVAGTNISGHYYLAADVDYDFGETAGSYINAISTTCLNLNGKTANITNGRFLAVLGTVKTVSIMDTAGGAVVTGSHTENGATLLTHNKAGSDLHLYGGTYREASSAATAAIVVRAGSLNVYEGATISGATNTGNGGNIVLAADDTFALGTALNLYGGTIEGGSAKRGGNVYAGRGTTVNICDGAILNGTASSAGGNIYAAGATTPAELSPITAVNVYGGFIGGGDNYSIWLANSETAFCSLTMEAGTVVGGVAAAVNITANISGATKIVPSAEYNGELYTSTLGLLKCSFDETQLTKGADIWTSGSSYTWCPECDALETWTTVTEPVANASGHYRFKSDLVYTYETSANNSLLNFVEGGNSCVDLNGCDVTVNLGRFLVLGTVSGTVTVMDTVGGAVVTGTSDRYASYGRTLYVIAPDDGEVTLNLKGGTYKGALDNEGTHDGDSAVATIRKCGTINLYEGATIDGRGLEKNVATVSVGNEADAISTFNLEGGTVYGATHTSNAQGGAFTVGTSKNSAELNIKSGTIYAGNCVAGEAMLVKNGNTVNISGGLILPREDSTKTVIYMNPGAAANISGGVIVGYINQDGATETIPASTVTLSGAPVITTEYTVGETTYTGTMGLRPCGDALVNVDGLTADADIDVYVADYNVPFTTAYTGDVDMGQVFTTNLEKAVLDKNADNQLMFVKAAEPTKDKFEPWNFDGMAYCPICGGEAPVEWTAIDGTFVATEAGKHYYLAADIDYDFGETAGSYINAGSNICINLNGKTANITNGRFLDVSTVKTVNIMDTEGSAVVTGSHTENGATIRTNNKAGSDLHLYGGTYQKAGTGATAAIVVRAGSLNVYEGATISGATNTGNGGNVVLSTDDTFTLGTALNLRGGTIVGGSAKRGGNVYAGRGTTVNIYDGAILNGTASSAGGNIYAVGATTPAELSPITAVNVYGGFIGGGDNYSIWLANSETAFCSLTMEAGTVVGGVAAAVNITANISGATKIVPSAVYNGETYTGTYGLLRCSFDETQLTKGADIWTSDSSYTWCPECDALETWTTVTEPVANASGHYRFKSDLVYPFASAGNNSLLKFYTEDTESCVDLNGCDVTVKLGRFLVQSGKCTVNVMDMVGGAVVTADCDRYGNTGRTVMVSAAGAILNLKGGTYKGAPDGDDTNTNAAPVARVTNGTLNLYEGATIDGRGLEQNVATVFVGDAVDTASIFNLEGGTVYGATHTTSAQGGAFTVGTSKNSAVLNVKSGTIYAGNCVAGEAMLVKNGNTVNISGGLILPREDSTKTVIYTNPGAAANISGGVIVGYIYQDGATYDAETGAIKVPASTVTLSGAPVITTEYTVGETTYTGTYGLRPRGNALVNVDGLTADADIDVYVADYNVPFTTAYTGDVDMSQVLTTNLGAAIVVKNADNQLMFAKAAAMIGDNKYATLEEALTAYDIANGEKIAFTGEAVIAEDIILDAANSGGAAISGTGTVYGIDTTNDDFSGYKKITVTGDVVVAAETVDAATGYRYMALKEGESTYGFHRFETKLTHVTLRTTAAGLYYKASYQCDTLVRDRVLAYGVALSVQDMPDANFLADNGNLYTVIEGQFATEYGKEAANTVKTTSGSVFGILKNLSTGRTAEANTAALTTDIYANSYILVDTDGNGETQFFMADTANGGKKRTDEGFTGTARNLLEVVTAINDPAVLEDLTETQKTNLVSFAQAWVGQFDADGEAKWATATSNIKA